MRWDSCRFSGAAAGGGGESAVESEQPAPVVPAVTTWRCEQEEADRCSFGLEDIIAASKGGFGLE